MRKNLANLIVLIRTALVFVILPMLEADSSACRIAGLFMMILIALFDGLDGCVARKLGIVSSLGARLDTLGDRITENVLFIYLACRGLVPPIVPLVFVTRSLLADFVRSLHDKRGVSTFEMNDSWAGRQLVASKFARTTYLLLKFAVFMTGATYLTLTGILPPNSPLMTAVHSATYQGAIAAVGFNLLRFAILLYDSKDLLREEFEV